MSDVLIERYRSMYRIRRFEEMLVPLFSEGLIRGSTHLAVGQEAVAVGVAAALRSDDMVLGTYRGHHHVLAGGSDPKAVFAEILGRTTGLCKGRGGSMHITDVSTGFYGEHAIVGAQLPIAVGCAWSAHVRSSAQVTVCFFGDGTTTIGAFHEALNLASVWKLPIVFVCENNLYSEYSPISSVCPVPDPAASRASAYGLAPVVVDGNNVIAVEKQAQLAVDKARSGGGCSMIEAQTYRHLGHSRSDPGTYRPPAEVASWLARDPIEATARTLIERGVTDQVLATVRLEVDGALLVDLEAAKEAPEPLAASMFDYTLVAPQLEVAG